MNYIILGVLIWFYVAGACIMYGFMATVVEVRNVLREVPLRHTHTALLIAAITWPITSLFLILPHPHKK